MIISDPGVFTIAKEVCPEIDIHISTQSNNVNYMTFRFWKEQGATRVVTARELSLEEIGDIRKNIPDDFEIETFVHGAMCISYSGRCLLSHYFTGRDANLGACTHPCRWKYYIMEEKRPGEFLPVEENERGTYIFNSKDLCMIEHIPELVNAGIDSFKIEGRMKTALYVAVVSRTYRQAIDDYLKIRKNISTTFRIIKKRLQNVRIVSLRPDFSSDRRRMTARFTTITRMSKAMSIWARSMKVWRTAEVSLSRKTNSVSVTKWRS